MRREHRQAPEQDLFVLVEQVVAPGDGGVQRLLAGNGYTAATTKNPQRIVEAGGDLRRRQGRGPRRGEFQGERHSVQADTDLGHRGRRRLVEHELGRRVTRPLDEQSDRLQLGQVAKGWQGSQIWQGK